MTTLELIEHYADLLIVQYKNKPKAQAHVKALVAGAVLPQVSVQTVTMDQTPDLGTLVLSYGGSSITLHATDNAAAVQSKLRALSGLSAVTVTGTLDEFAVTFSGVTPPALLLQITSNTLTSSGTAVKVEVDEIDQILPLAIQNGFNLTGANVATGAQLDILGKYAGVLRTAVNVSGPITLGDADFLSLIRFAVLSASAGSSLATIQLAISQAFEEGQILLFDYQNMHMSYLFSSTIGSQDLASIVLAEGLLPKPMGVQLASIIYAGDITEFFGFRSYELAAYNANPFNDYASYALTWPWVSYQMTIGTTASALATEDGYSLVQEDGTSLILS